MRFPLSGCFITSTDRSLRWPKQICLSKILNAIIITINFTNKYFAVTITSIKDTQDIVEREERGIVPYVKKDKFNPMSLVLLGALIKLMKPEPLGWDGVLAVCYETPAGGDEQESAGRRCLSREEQHGLSEF